MLIKFKSFKKAGRQKYENTPTRYDGHRFDSSSECDYYKHLLKLQRAGAVQMILRQVPFHLTSNSENIAKYVCDFQVFYKNGTIEFVDVKGIETDMFKLKKKLVESQYPVEIKVLKKGEW